MRKKKVGEVTMKTYSGRRGLNRGYMKLEVWHNAIDLNRIVHDLVKGGDVELKVRGQLVDAAQSVPANIAEGYSRRSVNEYIQHLYVALGSLSEVLTRCICLKETDQTTDQAFDRVDTVHYAVENKVWGLIRSLQEKRNSGEWIDTVAGAEAVEHPKR
jgi:four helix bundle protein